MPRLLLSIKRVLICGVAVFAVSGCAKSADIPAAKRPPIDRPPEFFEYERIVRKRIKKEWWYKGDAKEMTAQVALEIEPSGDIKNVTLKRRSGLPAFDQSVLRAVRNATPLPPPPGNVYHLFKAIVLTFDPRE